ncbi:MAG: ABC transporter permease, partial [Geminicoccaceae bacterium]|nr:ABC transporter permease [Geminicoccaceae bacterium]
MSVSGLLRRPWLWAWAGALAVWLATAAFTGGRGSAEVLSTALVFGAFFVIVALGQMFVITLGPGNVDLSIPACMTLAGTVSMKAMAGAASMIPLGLLLALLVG